MKEFIRAQAELVAAFVFGGCVVAGMALGALRLETSIMLVTVLIPAGIIAALAYWLVRRL